MENLLADQLEYLLSCNLQGKRFARHLLVLSGALADAPMPENINRQMITLSRQVLLQETLDSLIDTLNQLFRRTLPTKTEVQAVPETACPERAALIAQIEDTRHQLLQAESINYAELIAWIVAQAKLRKIWSKRGR